MDQESWKNVISCVFWSICGVFVVDG